MRPNYTESWGRAPALRVVRFALDKIVLTARWISRRMSMQAVLPPLNVMNVPVVTNLRMRTADRGRI